MFRPCNRMESTILASNSTKLLCLLPTLPNPLRRSRTLRSREQWRSQNVAPPGDSSSRRTSPPLPAPGRSVVVSAIMAPDIFAWSCDPKRWRAKTRSRPGYELLSHSLLWDAERRCTADARLPRSVSPRGCRHADEIFGNDRETVGIIRFLSLECGRTRFEFVSTGQPRSVVVDGDSNTLRRA